MIKTASNRRIYFTSEAYYSSQSEVRVTYGITCSAYGAVRFFVFKIGIYRKKDTLFRNGCFALWQSNYWSVEVRSILFILKCVVDDDERGAHIATVHHPLTIGTVRVESRGCVL